MKEARRVPTGGSESLSQNPFAALSGAGLPPTAPVRSNSGSAAGAPPPSQSGRRASDSRHRVGTEAISEVAGSPGLGPGLAPAAGAAAGRRGRVDILRETGGRAGKTVTVAANFTGIGLPEKEALAKRIRAACGCGGTVKDGRIEIQGDQRDTVARILAEAGFRPVFAGG